MPLLLQKNRTGANYLTLSTDGGVLFDPARDRLIKLNRVGAEIWLLLSQGKLQRDVAEIVAQRYGVDSRQVLEDVRQLLERALMMSLAPERTTVVEIEQIPASGNQRTFPWYGQHTDGVRSESSCLAVLQALLGLLLFDVVLAVSSADILFRIVASRTTKQCDHRPSASAIGEICTAVERACVWYPRRTLCLQRSAVTTCLLRRYGIVARLAIGVRFMPFLAHAWVEAEGAVVNDFPRVKSFYRTLAFY